MVEELDPVRLKEELEQFKKEKEKIRRLMGQIGGKADQEREKWINVFFLVLILILFAGDIARHFFHLPWPISSTFSLELAVLLVSLKIIWMMHKATKVEHFQFWILNSIEFQLNEVVRRLRKLERTVEKYHTEEETR